jgi:23S rRNA maturation-related 3'-5' exoribonuclease YhaM
MWTLAIDKLTYLGLSTYPCKSYARPNKRDTISRSKIVERKGVRNSTIKARVHNICRRGISQPNINRNSFIKKMLTSGR